MVTTRSAPGSRARRAPKLDLGTYVRDFRNKHRVPAISVAAFRHGEQVADLTYGYREGPSLPWTMPMNHPDWVLADSGTVFRLASISKAVTAVLALRLAARGRLDLDKSIHRYIDDFPKTKGRITPRSLLAHTAGIRHYEGRRGTGRYTKPAWDDCTAPAPLVYDTTDVPLKQYFYSTHAYTVLGACLEYVSGKDFPRLLENELSIVGRDLIYCSGKYPRSKPTKVSQLWKLRSSKAKTIQSRFMPTSEDRLNWKWAGGGMLSTASRLGRFGAAVIDGTLLSDDWLEEMWSPQRLWNGKVASSRYGLGWRLGSRLGSQVVSHNGDQRGASSTLRMNVDRGLVVTVLTNTRDLPVASLGRALLNALDDHTRPEARKRVSTRKGSTSAARRR